MKKILLPFLITVFFILLLFFLFDDMEVFFTRVLQGESERRSVYAILSFAILTSDIVLPVPSSIVMYTNGFVLGVLKGALLSLVSVMVAIVFGYFLGRFTSQGLKSERDQRTELLLNKYGPVAILLSRGIPVLSESVCVVCGFNRMNFQLYLVLNFLGYIPVCIIYAWMGSLGESKDSFLITFLASLLIASIFFFVWRRWQRSH